MFPSMLRIIVSMVWIKKTKLQLIGFFITQTNNTKRLWFLLAWHGKVLQTFFLNEKVLKVNAKTYNKHLKKQLFPEIDQLMNGTSWIFLQDSAPSHPPNLVQNFLEEILVSKFIKHTEWPPSSPDYSSLDYHFWNKIKEKVYEDRIQA